MKYWLFKTEPGEYSYYNLEMSKRDVWDGVKNYAALKNIRQMSPGDLSFIYHTGKEKAVVGVAGICSQPYPDPSDERLVLIDIEARYRLKSPVKLSDIKSDPSFSDWELVRLPRLSVMPVQEKHWIKIHQMSGVLMV